jgi:UDP-2,3-diacylglucosamine pyrophosphatase LpxH
MLVVVSDLHMTDRETGAPVTDVELEAFVRQVERLEPREEGVTLLLLGDIIDLLRSERWGRLWNQRKGAAPWSHTERGFADFVGSHPERVVLAIVKTVAQRYGRFAAPFES